MLRAFTNTARSSLTRRSLTKASVSKRFFASSLAHDELTKDILDDIRLSPLEQPVFEQAVKEVVTSLGPLFEKEPIYLSVLTTLCEPERMIMFRVPWIDDRGVQQINRGYRVQFNNALGPYKGGLRFHPTVDLSIIKFLGFEQTFKNALTGLPIGSAKGGSDFDPKGKSNREVFKFCRSFMTELAEFIGPDKDIPAGDIGVGAREIGYLYGQYKRITKNFHGVLTGKTPGWGGSFIRKEATGYGLVYIAECSLADELNENLENSRCVVSGSGNVALYAAEKLLDLGAKVLTFSDSGGYIYEPDGFTREQFHAFMDLKEVKRGRCSDYLELSKTAQYFPGERPWNVPCDIDHAFPSATQNELDENDAKILVEKNCRGVFEGANMPTTNEGIEILQDGVKIYYPAKAANAGGVAVSCLEMAQNSARLVWPREDVDARLKKIMQDIHAKSKHAAEDLNRPGDFQLGANAAGFKKVADAMFQTGIVFHPDTY